MQQVSVDNWKELAKRLGWDGLAESGMRNILQHWAYVGPAKEGGLLFRKRAGIDGDSWPPEDLYMVLEDGYKPEGGQR